MADTLADKATDEAVDELISQPIEGLLYDLNMLPEVLATHDKEDSKEWLVMRVIERLHHKANEDKP